MERSLQTTFICSSLSSHLGAAIYNKYSIDGLRWTRTRVYQHVTDDGLRVGTWLHRRTCFTEQTSNIQLPVGVFIRFHLFVFMANSGTIVSWRVCRIYIWTDCHWKHYLENNEWLDETGDVHTLPWLTPWSHSGSLVFSCKQRNGSTFGIYSSKSLCRETERFSPSQPTSSAM